MVFVPCSFSQGSGANDEGILAQKDSNRLLVVSIGQFRHEKQHKMQLNIMHRLQLTHPQHMGNVCVLS